MVTIPQKLTETSKQMQTFEDLEHTSRSLSFWLFANSEDPRLNCAENAVWSLIYIVCLGDLPLKTLNFEIDE